MAFFETPRFPDAISYGAIGGPGYSTDLITVASGAESRNSNWSESRYAYEVSQGVKDNASMRDLVAFFRAMKGKTNGFRFKDWADFQVTTANGFIGTTGLGAGLAANQLYKAYVFGAAITQRKIKKPVVGSVAIYRGGSLVLAGGSAGQYAIDTTTGIVTFIADASINVTAAVPVGISYPTLTYVTLSSVMAGVSIGGRLYISGATGTMAPALNNLSHAVYDISGTIYTLTVTTTGLVYSGGGIASKYAQPSESLTWSGEFDVPCRFDIDEMKVSIETKNWQQWSQIPIVELIKP